MLLFHLNKQVLAAAESLATRSKCCGWSLETTVSLIRETTRLAEMLVEGEDKTNNQEENSGENTRHSSLIQTHAAPSNIPLMSNMQTTNQKKKKVTLWAHYLTYARCMFKKRKEERIPAKWVLYFAPTLEERRLDKLETRW